MQSISSEHRQLGGLLGARGAEAAQAFADLLKHLFVGEVFKALHPPDLTDASFAAQATAFAAGGR